MKLSWKSGAALVLGGLILGGSLSAMGQDGGDEVPVEERSEDARGERDGNGGPDGKGRPGHHFIGRGMVRSEALVEGEEDGTFNTIKVDKGILRSVDGTTLNIEEADGTEVKVPTDDDTNFGRDGERAELGDLEVGDHVFAHQVKEGDADFVTRHVGAMSAERYAEMEAQREACTDDDEATECEHKRHRGPGGPGRPGGPGGFRPGMRPGSPNGGEGGEGEVSEAPAPAGFGFEEAA